jgi:hypothetical protein
MTPLRKILEELLFTHKDDALTPLGEAKVKLAHQQILEMIPKRKDDTCFCDSMKVCKCDIKERESFNACIDAMEQSMTGER